MIGGGNRVGAGDVGPHHQLITAGATQHQPNAVLRVIIENMIYPVTLDVLYSVRIWDAEFINYASTVL